MIVISPKSTELTTPIFSNDKTAAIVLSEGGFFFLNLKTKQGKIIGATRNEAMEQLNNMDIVDDFPDF
jgi:hypothetical protein